MADQPVNAPSGKADPDPRPGGQIHNKVQVLAGGIGQPPQVQTGKTPFPGNASAPLPKAKRK